MTRLSYHVMLIVSYIVTDDQHRVMPRIYTTKECVFTEPNEDLFPELTKRFDRIEKRLMANEKRGQIIFLARSHVFKPEMSLDDRVECLKGCRFDRDQIQQIRQIANSCEQALNLEEKNGDGREVDSASS